MKYKYGVIKINNYTEGEVKDFELLKVVDFNPLNSIYLTDKEPVSLELKDSYSYLNDYNSDIFYNWSVSENYLSLSSKNNCELDTLSSELDKVYSFELQNDGDD